MKKIICLLFVLLFSLCATCCNEKDLIEVGIVQYVIAPPLDDAREGIINGLKENGFVNGENINITVYQCMGNPSTMNQCVKSATEKSDIIFSIATPCTTALKNEIETKGLEIPVLFTAVTNPVGDKIVSSLDDHNSLFSGTSDMNPVHEQVALISDLVENPKKIGFIYTAGETNSVAQLALFNEKAQELGLETVVQAITQESEIKNAVDSLINSGVDAIYLPTDNIIVSNCNVVLKETNLSKVPTICGESSFIDFGGTISYSISYSELGLLTGKMGSRVLNGEDIKKMKVETLTEFDLVLNATKAEESSIFIKEELKTRADITK